MWYDYIFESIEYIYYRLVYFRWALNIKRFFLFRYQKLTRGFSDNELWNLDVTIAKFILPRLKHFRNNIKGYPSGISEKEWIKKLDAMIYSFEYLASDDVYGEYNVKTQAKVDKGLSLFIKHYNGLWQ